VQVFHVPIVVLNRHFGNMSHVVIVMAEGIDHLAFLDVIHPGSRPPKPERTNRQQDFSQVLAEVMHQFHHFDSSVREMVGQRMPNGNRLVESDSRDIGHC
jgi:hypothetical protein